MHWYHKHLFSTALLLIVCSAACAQLRITPTSPTRNSIAAPATGPIVVTFAEAVQDAKIQLFSSRRGGLLQGDLARPSPTTLLFTPNQRLQPGETVQAIVLATADGLAPTHTYQFTTAVAAGYGAFQVGADFAMGRQPFAAVAADINGDGRLDLLSADYGANSVSLRLNTGNGTFAAREAITVQSLVEDVVTADVDGDGDLDLLALCQEAHLVAVRFNDGQGHFHAFGEVSVGEEPYTMSVADVDGDGDLDLLTASNFTNLVTLCLNDGQGNFSRGTPLPSGGRGLYAVTPADVDSDGDLDLLLTNYLSGTISLRVNDGRGHFSGATEIRAGERPYRVSTADVDADGDLDLLVPNQQTEGTVTVLVNDGRGGFTARSPAVRVGKLPVDVAPADVDGDGDLDLLTANFGDDAVSVCLNDGRGVFTETTRFQVARGPRRLMAADLDEDGDLDVLTSNLDGNSVSIRFNESSYLTWTGAQNQQWLEGGNWLPAKVPTAADDVVIPAGAPRYPLLLTGTATAQRLTLGPGGSLTLRGGTLDLKGSFVNDGTLAHVSGVVRLSGAASQAVAGAARSTFADLSVGNAGASFTGGPVQISRVLTLAGNLNTGDRLTLLSDANGTAMVVNRGGVATGMATVQRYVSGDLNLGAGYRHFASPVSGAAVSDLRGPGQSPPVVNAHYNLAYNPNAVLPFPTVFAYDERRLTSTPATSRGFNVGWQSPESLDDLLAPGQGYSANLAPTTLGFTGTLRTGNQTVPLTRGATAASGWALLGNPYPAPINWNNLVRPAELDDALYVFRSSDQYSGSYVSYVNGMGPEGVNLIASGQGFFARVSPTQTAATLTFTDAARELGYVSPVHYRGTDTRPTLALALQAATGAPGPSTDVLYVYQEIGATPGFDRHYDALKVMLNGGQQPTLYAAAGTENLSIQGLPATGEPQALPLGVHVPAAGRFAFTVQRLASFPASTALYLEDKQTGTWHDLRTAAPYAVALSPGLSTQRFVLHLGGSVLATRVGVGTQPFAELQVFPNPAIAGQDRVRAVVRGPAAALQHPHLELLNALGQRVHDGQAPASTLTAGSLTLDVPVGGLSAGLYTLRLITSAGVLTHQLTVH